MINPHLVAGLDRLRAADGVRCDSATILWEQAVAILGGWDSLALHRDMLQRFKDFVHARLDAAGVPTHPNGPHSAEGCRIGDRLDLLFAERAALQASLDAIR